MINWMMQTKNLCQIYIPLIFILALKRIAFVLKCWNVLNCLNNLTSFFFWFCYKNPLLAGKIVLRYTHLSSLPGDWVRYRMVWNYDMIQLNYEEKYCTKLLMVFSGILWYRNMVLFFLYFSTLFPEA